MGYFSSLEGEMKGSLATLVQQCRLVEKWQYSTELDTHPVGLSGSLPSSHLKVTFLADGAGVAGEIRPFWCPACPTLIEWFSSSSSNARNEHDIWGDWIGAALQNQGGVNI